MRVVRDLALAIALLSAGACIDAARVNSTCTWSDPVAGRLDLGRQSDRDHLRQDEQIAWELSVRYGDVRFRTDPASARPLRRGCRQAIEDTIAARHAVTAEDMRIAARSRVWWVDVVFVYLPMFVLAIVATDQITRRIVGAFSIKRRVKRVVSALLLASVVALISTGVTQHWAMSVESLRLRDSHVADRGTVLPTMVHPGLTFAIAFLASLITAMPRLCREPRERDAFVLAP